MINILITGGKGAIAEYIIRELKQYTTANIAVIDNMWKHHQSRWEDTFKDIEVVDADCRDQETMRRVMRNKDVVIANAALVGGISMFHKQPYDILRHNDQIMGETIDAALYWAQAQQVIYIGSSMAYEKAKHFPVMEGDENFCPPPKTHYGWSKMSGERYLQAAHEQYGLNYTICRLFNCVAIGEDPKINEPGYSHVIPDAILKTQQSTGDIEIFGDGEQVRCFTHAADVARGIRRCILFGDAYLEDFNLVSGEEWRILDVFKRVWYNLRPNDPFRPVFVPSFDADVQKRWGVHTKASTVLGWSIDHTVAQIIDEACEFGVRPWE